MDPEYQLITKIYGTAASETIRLLLEAAGIDVFLAQESAGKSIYPVTIGKMAQVKVFVRNDQAEEALAILKDVEDGKYLDTPDLENLG